MEDGELEQRGHRVEQPLLVTEEAVDGRGLHPGRGADPDRSRSADRISKLLDLIAYMESGGRRDHPVFASK